MCKRNTYRLPLEHPLLGTWPTSQACALTFSLQASTQSTEPHQPGLFLFLKNLKNNLDSFSNLDRAPEQDAL